MFMTIKPTELAVIVLLAVPEPTSVGFPVFNVVQSTECDIAKVYNRDAYLENVLPLLVKGSAGSRAFLMSSPSRY